MVSICWGHLLLLAWLFICKIRVVERDFSFMQTYDFSTQPKKEVKQKIHTKINSSNTQQPNWVCVVRTRLRYSSYLLHNFFFLSLLFLFAGWFAYFVISVLNVLASWTPYNTSPIKFIIDLQSKTLATLFVFIFSTLFNK